MKSIKKKEYSSYIQMFVQILQHTSHNQLEALSERRPPWPRQIITPIWPLKNIEAWWWKTNPSPQKKQKKQKKKQKKRFGSLPAPQSGYATPIMVFLLLIYFAHSRIAEGPHVTQIL